MSAGLTLDEAIGTGRLDDFIAQAEAEGVAAADAELERPAKKKKKRWNNPKQFFIVFSPEGPKPPVVVHPTHAGALAAAWQMANQSRRIILRDGFDEPSVTRFSRGRAASMTLAVRKLSPVEPSAEQRLRAVPKPDLEAIRAESERNAKDIGDDMRAETLSRDWDAAAIWGDRQKAIHLPERVKRRWS